MFVTELIINEIVWEINKECDTYKIDPLSPLLTTITASYGSISNWCGLNVFLVLLLSWVVIQTTEFKSGYRVNTHHSEWSSGLMTLSPILNSVTGINPQSDCLQFQFVYLCWDKRILPLPLHKCLQVCSHDVVLTLFFLL